MSPQQLCGDRMKYIQLGAHEHPLLYLPMLTVACLHGNSLAWYWAAPVCVDTSLLYFRSLKGLFWEHTCVNFHIKEIILAPAWYCNDSFPTLETL